MPQPDPMQQPGVNNMQLWQQLLMYRQIQEPQRQQQFKQLDQCSKQQNSLSQLSAAAKPAPVNQLPVMINEVPMNHASDCIWPNTFVSNLPLVPANPQTFVAENINWLQLNGSPVMPNIASGLIISNDQIQPMHSMGLIPQQLDQTFHGIPISSTKGSIFQNPQFLGMSNDCTDLTIKGARNKAVKTLDPFNSLQNDQSFVARNISQERTFDKWNFHGKGSFDNDSMKNLSNHASLGNFPQTDHLKHKFHIQELQDRQGKADWLSNLQENPIGQEETPCNVAASLDATEQKVLFGIDDDHHPGVPFGGSLNSYSGNSPFGSSLETGYFGATPSVQSGSWSALMQEAVQVCSSDKELQEEWSDLSFQKMEQSVARDSVMSNDNVKQPTTWDDSYLQSASSLTSKPLPSYNDADACSNSGTSPSIHNSFRHDGTNRVQSGAPQVFRQLSAGKSNHKQFHQVQKQKQFFDGGPHAQFPLTDGLLMEQSYQQCANNSVDMQHMEGRWTYQQNVALVNFPGESSNRPNGWNNSYTMAPGRDCTSDVCDNDGNMGKLGGSNIYVNAEQPAESDIGSSVQAEDFVVDYYGSVVDTDNFELNDEMNQQVTYSGQIASGQTFTLDACVNSSADENVERNKNQPSGRPEWDNSDKSINTSYEDKKELQMVSGEDYTPNSLNHLQHSNAVNGAKEIPIFTANDQNSFVSGSQKSLIQTGQQTVGSKMMKSPRGSLGTNMEHLFPTDRPLIFRGMPISLFQGSENEEQMYVGKSKFADPVDSNNPRVAVDAKKLHSRNIIPIHASSSSFNGSIDQYSPHTEISRTSQNMLELLHKVDQSMNTAMDMPSQVAFGTASHFGQASAVQGFGLHLAPPSQQLSNFALPLDTSVNDFKSRHLDPRAGDRDQTWSTSIPSVQSHPPQETDQTKNWGCLSRQEHKLILDSNKQYKFSSAIAPNFCYVGNQLQGQQPEQHIPSSAGYRTSDQPMNFSIINQANVNALVNSTLPLHQPHKSHDGATADRSIQRTLAGRVAPSRVASSGDTHVPDGSQLQSAVMDNTKQMITDFSQIRSSMYTNTEPMSGLKPSLAGTSHQVDPLTRLGYQGSKGEIASSEVSASPACLQNREYYSNEGTSSKPTISEKMDAIAKSETEFHGQEPVGNALLEGNSNASLSSLACLHQQSVDKGKNGQDSTCCSQAICPSITRITSSGSDIMFSGCISNPSDVQQQNHSLLYQMQAMQEADSDPSKRLQSRLRGADLGSNSSYVYWNNDKRYVHGQDTEFRVPADGKLGANSQSSLPSDAKLLNFASKENGRKNMSTSSSAGRHDLQNHISSLSSAANLIRGNECIHANPFVASSQFEKYGTHKHDMVVAEYDGQRSAKVDSQLNFSPKLGSTENNFVIEHRIGISHACTCEKSSLTSKVAFGGSSTHSLPSTIIDHDIVLRSRKRKSSTTELLPWHKVTQAPRKLRSISMAELDWAQAANKLIEKVHDVAEAMVNGSRSQPRRRLILTTQLMQQLFPAVPFRMLSLEAISAYENVIFFVAKSTLADACSLISWLGRDSHVHLEKDNVFSENVPSSKKAEDHVFSKIMEVLIGRSWKLESDFSRLDERTSVLDVRMECQELEKFSIVNRLGKFHGRPPAAEESSSTSEAEPCKTFPQSYIAAVPVSGDLPEGVPCLSLFDTLISFMDKAQKPGSTGQDVKKRPPSQVSWLLKQYHT